MKKSHRKSFTAKKVITQRPLKLLSVLDKKYLLSVLDKTKLLSVLDKTKLLSVLDEKKLLSVLNKISKLCFNCDSEVYYGFSQFYV